MLDNGLIRTGLLLAAPFLVPRALRHLESFLRPPRPRTRPPQQFVRAKDGQGFASFRLFVYAFGVSISLFTALSPPHNLFQSLSKPDSVVSLWFPSLRQPLDLRLATETLHRLWVEQLSRPLNERELELVQRLHSLQQRLGYVGFGSSPVLDCTWCTTTTTTTTSTSLDYLLMVLPGISLGYLTILIGVGLLASGHGRERWRLWGVLAVGLGFGNEVWKRLVWEGLRFNPGQTHFSVSMLHSTLHLQRSVLAALYLSVAYFAPTNLVPLELEPSSPSSSPLSTTTTPTTSSVITPALRQVVEQSRQVLERLRILGIERMAVLHSDQYRFQVNEFWSIASEESKLARSDPTIQALLYHRDDDDDDDHQEEEGEEEEGQGRREGEAEEREGEEEESHRVKRITKEFEEFIETSFMSVAGRVRTRSERVPGDERREGKRGGGEPGRDDEMGQEKETRRERGELR